MYTNYEYFNLCPRCQETVPPFGCCVFCNFSEADDAVKQREAKVSPELQRIKDEVDREMKIFAAML